MRTAAAFVGGARTDTSPLSKPVRNCAVLAFIQVGRPSEMPLRERAAGAGLQVLLEASGLGFVGELE